MQADTVNSEEARYTHNLTVHQLCAKNKHCVDKNS
jgi:hypothetical protein